MIVCLVSWGPLFRSALDKLWMHSEGLSSIGQWAQLQTLSDLIGAPVGAGIGIGVTILAAQTPLSSQRILLVASGALGLLITLPLLLLTLFFYQDIGRWTGLESIHHHGLVMAAIGGWLGTLTIQISAFLLGINQHFKALLIMIVSSLPTFLTLSIGVALHTNSLMEKTLLATVLSGLAFIIGFLFFIYQTLKQSSQSKTQFKKALHELSKFIYAGFAIGILTPLSMMIARSTIASHLDWNSVGMATALWRVSDWILCIAQAVLFFHFLPLLSKEAGINLIPRIKRLVIQVFIPSLFGFFILFIFRKSIFSHLYSDQLQIDWEVCLLFWSGDACRVLAIIFLLALYILKGTKTISFVEFFSQPLLALLLILGAANSLIGVGKAHLLTYTLYALLCLLGMMGLGSPFFYKSKKYLPTRSKKLSV